MKGLRAVCSLALVFFTDRVLGGIYDPITVASVKPWPSTGTATTNLAFDGSQATGWTSFSCRSGAWRTIEPLNALFNACASGYCSSSCSTDLSSATDNNPYTAGTSSFSHGEGRSWASFPFPSGDARNVFGVYVRGSWPTNTTLFGIAQDGTLTPITMLQPTQTYLDVSLPGPAFPIKGLYLQAQTKDGVMRGFCYSGVGDCKSLSITEIAVQTVDCYEELSVDLGYNKVLTRMDVRFNGFVGGSMATSIDGVNFFDRLDLMTIPSSYFVSQKVFISNITARYVRLRFLTDPTNAWAKVNVNEVSFFGYNPAAAACPNQCSSKGVCNNGVCTCNVDRIGADCAVSACASPCGANGACVKGICVCTKGYSGVTCDAKICPNNCFNQGTCVSGSCVCKPGFSGSDCRFSVFTSINNGATKSNNLLDYRTVLGGQSFTAPAAVTKYYQEKAVCSISAPVTCSDNTCAVSEGACVTSKIPKNTAWNSISYETNTIPVSAVIVSSNSGNAANAKDGLSTTFWQSSTSCYPTNYMNYAHVNILTRTCATAGKCAVTSSGGLVTTTAATSSTTDINSNTANSASLFNGKASFQVQLSAPTALAAISLKVATNTNGVAIIGVTSSNAKIFIAKITESYTFRNYDLMNNLTLNKVIFTAILLESVSSFSLFEISARSAACSEYAAIDFGSAKTVTALNIRHYAGGTAGNVVNTLYESSLDGTTWQTLRSGSDVPSMLTSNLDVLLSPAISARFIRVRHVLKEQVSANVFVWEISAWGPDGKYGSLNTPKPNAVNFRDLLGVNGIWAWGGQGWSNLAHQGWGPKRLAGVASHARNYHNWNWDVTDPDNIPNFEKMSCGGGTEAQWWLSWDWEYAGWNAAGLEVDACIQFTTSSFAATAFNDPYRAGYNYGYAFAKHFGRNGGTGQVAALEVGNEPWSYSASLYGQVLLGMAKGVKDADPSMRVLPAAFASLSDTLARVNSTHLQYLDAFNIHAYSWLDTVDGKTGIYPEHKLSSLHSVNSLIRFRDAVAPNVPIYLTEWGWDSAGGGEDCNPPPERAGQAPTPQCVSELAQAVYAIRGSLVLARKNLARLTWYFYGNTVMTPATWDQAKSLFARSGLTSSSSANFQDKISMNALRVFIGTLGSTHFHSVIQENDNAYVYLLCNDNEVVTHVVAWRPINGDDSSTSSVSFTLSGAAKKASVLGYAQYTSAALPSVSGGNQWTMTISALPTVVQLVAYDVDPGIDDTCPTACLNGAECVGGSCQCLPGYLGSNCGQVYCPNFCWQKGTCMADGSCICDKYWSTAGAGEYQKCNWENYLSAGNCRDNPTEYDAASSCFLPRCKNDCNGHGTCSSSGCVCDIGYSGSACEKNACPFNCRSHGVCNDGICACRPGFVGPSCEWPDNVDAKSKFCSADEPFTCSDGSCAISAGDCVTPAPPATYSAETYDSLNIPVVSVKVSSNVNNAMYAADGSINSAWQSGVCYPTGYFSNSFVNLLSGICANAYCTITTNLGLSSDATAATDMNTDSSVGVSVLNGVAFFESIFPNVVSIKAVSVKLSQSSDVSVYGITAGGIKTLLGTVSSSYSFLNFDNSLSTVFAKIRLESVSSFNLFEISARSAACSEYAAIDFGSAKTVTALNIRHYAGGTAGNVVNTLYESSLDGTTWQTLRSGSDVPSMLTSNLDVLLSPAISARFIRVRHVLKEQVSANVFVWEISAWGPDGKYGSLNTPKPNAVNFRDLLGVNGIWGWGTNTFSSKLKSGSGPNRYNSSSSHARNYHNWIWDVTDPDNIPRYDEMVGRGSIDFGIIPGHSSKLNQNWLNWDNEYTSWKSNGLQVECSIQFTENDFPESVFTNPYDAGYNYGYAFAKHFGMLRGTGDVSGIEVGNEPWSYSASLYGQVLLGMAKGVKDADPSMRVLPAAFASLSDTLARVNSTHLQYLDAFNIHAYSWLDTVDGKTGIYPEHKLSSLHSVNSLIRFRDAVAPNVPIYLTEWGWDSAGGGEDCNPPPERAGQAPTPQCVSELAQAVYAIRGSLVLARKNLARLTWYFYGNTVMTPATWDQAKSLFARSGLTSSSAAGFKNKQALFALRVFIGTLGSTHFHSVIQENDDAYVYLLCNDNEVVTHVVAWRPINGDDSSTSSVSFTLSGAAKKASVLGCAQYTSAALPSVSGGNQWTMTISALPTVVELL